MMIRHFQTSLNTFSDSRHFLRVQTNGTLLVHIGVDDVKVLTQTSHCQPRCSNILGTIQSIYIYVCVYARMYVYIYTVYDHI